MPCRTAGRQRVEWSESHSWYGLQTPLAEKRSPIHSPSRRARSAFLRPMSAAREERLPPADSTVGFVLVWSFAQKQSGPRGCRPCRSFSRAPAAFRIPATDEGGERLPGAHPLPHPHPHVTASSPAAFATRTVPGPHPTCLAYWLSYNKSKTLMCAPHPLAIGRGPHPSLTLMLIGAQPPVCCRLRQ